MGERIALRIADARADIDVEGAQLRHWSVGGRSLLWEPDPTLWDDIAPILFPVVGWTRGGEIRVAGRSHPLGLHGFARSRRFAIAERRDDALVLADRADDETRLMYPFEYRIEIAYRLAADRLSCHARITNVGSDAMPYAFGLHPGFRWPSGRGRILFDQDEAPHVAVITSDGLFARASRPVPLAGRELALSHALLSSEALCFLDVASRGLTYEAEEFGRLRVELDDCAHVALWSRPPAPFLCIEAWTGHGDPEDFAGELADKPSMRVLPPGGSARHGASWRFTAPALHSAPQA